MSWLDGLRHRLRTLLRPRAYDAELREEMDFHLSLDAMQQGDAHRARRRFGNRTRHAEASRASTWLRFADALGRDLRYSWRALIRAPGVAVVVVLTLALGIGANAAAFTLLDEFYLRPPRGVSDPSTLRRLWVRHTKTGDGVPFASTALSYPLVQALLPAIADSTRSTLFTTDWSVRMGKQLDAPRVRTVYASSAYFATLGVRLAHGRPFTAEEDRFGAGVNVAVVSEAFRRRQFATASPLGRTFLVDTMVYTVIGVAPPGFTGLDAQAADVWVPLATLPVPRSDRGNWWEQPREYRLEFVGRVASDFADKAFATHATHIVRDFNRAQYGVQADTLSEVLSGPIIASRGPSRPGQDLVISTRLSGGALLLLVIACANVVNLLLARAMARRREVALRLSLGMSRGQLMRLLSIEPLMLAAIATVAATAMGAWGGSLLRALVMPEVEWTTGTLDARVAIFTAVIGLITGGVAALVPALQGRRQDLASALAATAPGAGVRQRSRLRQGLLVAQAAFSIILILGATLFVRSLRNVEGLDIGFDSRQLVFGRMRFASGERPPLSLISAGVAEIAERLRGRPGVEVVALSAMEPMQGLGFVNFYFGADSAASLGRGSPTMSAVSPEFFQATGMRLLMGTTFTVKGSRGAEVVVNDAMARLVWPGRNAIGECLVIERRTNPCYTVVGVVENVRRSSVIERESYAQFYLPLDHMPIDGWVGSTLVVRTLPGAMEAVATTMRSLMQERWPQGVPAITPMTHNLEPEYRPWRLGATLFTSFGVLAVIVALIGVYSTVSYAVSQRRREFGVRLALGARLSQILAQVVREGLRTVAIGAALGTALMVAFGRLIADLLYGITPREPVTLTVVALSLLVVSALSAVIPALRASRVDPVETLRTDA